MPQQPWPATPAHSAVPLPSSTLIEPAKPSPCPNSCNTTVTKSHLVDGVAPSVPKYQSANQLLNRAVISYVVVEYVSAQARLSARALAPHVLTAGELGASRMRVEAPALPRMPEGRTRQIGPVGVDVNRYRRIQQPCPSIECILERSLGIRWPCPIPIHSEGGACDGRWIEAQSTIGGNKDCRRVRSRGNRPEDDLRSRCHDRFITSTGDNRGVIGAACDRVGSLPAAPATQ